MDKQALKAGVHSACDEVFEHFAARAFFASAWADQCEETGNAGMMSGKQILDLIPHRFDPAAMHAAKTLRMDMEKENNSSVLAMFANVSDKIDSLSTFAHYCAMQAMGHGCGLGDYGIDADLISVPYVEFGSHSLESDYFEGTEE